MALAIWLALVLYLPGAANAPDFLDSLLLRVGWTRADLGIVLQPSWQRIPDPQRLPGTLPVVPDLLAHPLEAYPWLRALATSALQALTDTTPLGLYRTLYAVGVDPWLTGFRNYGANTWMATDSTVSPPTLAEALQTLWLQADAVPRPASFGHADPAPWQAAADTLALHVPQELQPLLARYLADLAEAVYWVRLARRRLSPTTMQALEHMPNPVGSQPDGRQYLPEVDDAWRGLDFPSLAYAALKVAEATALLAHALDTAHAVSRITGTRVKTPWGDLVLQGPGEDTLGRGPTLFVLDVGGDDRYTTGAGTNGQVPVAVLLDLRGNDRYEAPQGRALGSGLLGVALLWDHQGNDHYRSGDQSQGFGLLGYGLLYDHQGDDRYQAAEGAQGCGLWGVGLLVDRQGEDQYRLLGNGQGDGEYGGIGALVDVEGNDQYFAEPWSSVYDRGDYHSQYRVNASNAQGFGGGRRGDGSDGHSWAGGLGLLLDAQGHDRYTSGNWSLGTGYWFGLGALLDLAGDDEYRSCYFTQGSAAHFALGVFVDEAGNDRHPLFETAGAALGFGWDFAQALFVDFGGDDTYEAQRIALGTAEIWSHALFLDLGGNDVYRFPPKAWGFGATPPRKAYRQRSQTLPFLRDLKTFALFADFGGHDEYPAEGRSRNDTLWFQPPLDNVPRTFYGIGVDRPQRPTLRELDLWETP